MLKPPVDYVVVGEGGECGSMIICGYRSVEGHLDTCESRKKQCTHWTEKAHIKTTYSPGSF